MSRGRYITPERVAERFGTEERHLRHLCNRKEIQKRRTADPERKKAAVESIKKSVRRRYNENPKFHEEQNIRAYSGRLIKKLGLHKKGWEIHHLTPMSAENFLYMSAQDHKALHTVYGPLNSDVTLEKVLNSYGIKHFFHINYPNVQEVLR